MLARKKGRKLYFSGVFHHAKNLGFIYYISAANYYFKFILQIFLDFFYSLLFYIMLLLIYCFTVWILAFLWLLMYQLGSQQIQAIKIINIFGQDSADGVSGETLCKQIACLGMFSAIGEAFHLWPRVYFGLSVCKRVWMGLRAKGILEIPAYISYDMRDVLLVKCIVINQSNFYSCYWHTPRSIPMGTHETFIP